MEKVPKTEPEDEMEDEEEEEGAPRRPGAQTSLIRNPQVLAALQSRLQSLVGQPSEYIQSLPPVVKRRIKALKKIQADNTKVEAKFFQEVHALECKYAELYKPLYEKRRTIIGGDYEPNDDECDFPSDEEEEGLSDDIKEKVKLEEVKKEGDDKINGVPDFWLTTFRNLDLVSEMIQEHDEPIMKHLMDVSLEQSNEPMGFKILFFFSPNEYFENAVLIKEYHMKCVPDEADPFSFEGPEIVRCKGTKIDWKAGKNVTVKTIKKKQKHKSKGSVRTVTKTVQNDSFFNFFSPPEVAEDDANVDDETRSLLTADFEIGHYLRESIIPRAVLYFTGEALDEEDYDEEEEGEDEDGEEGEEEDADSDYDPAKAPKKAGKGQGAKGANPECSQQ